MKRKELFHKYELLSQNKKIYISGINSKSEKRTLKNAIECLELSDEVLDDYFEEFGKIDRGSWLAKCKRGDFKTHPSDRFDVYMSIKWNRITEMEREQNLPLSIYKEMNRINRKK